jgi:hypothetical protein
MIFHKISNARPCVAILSFTWGRVLLPDIHCDEFELQWGAVYLNSLATLADVSFSKGAVGVWVSRAFPQVCAIQAL